MATVDDYRSRAYSLLTALLLDRDFAYGTNYWQIGCVFDTVTDYLRQDAGFPDPKVNAETVHEIVSNVYARYQTLVQDRESNPNYCWYDDFGWWGIACSKSFDPDYTNIFGDQRGYFQKVALSTWETMHNGKFDHVHFGAPNVWNNCDQVVFAECEPRFPGGVWQYDIFGEFRTLDRTPPGCNPSTPIDVVEAPGGVDKDVQIYPALPLGPYQNTVTNGLYFMLANRLVAAGFERREPVDAIFGFFDKWCNDASLDPDHRLDRSVMGGRLILERVSTYRDKSIVHWWDPETSWGGDQGLLLGALAEYKQARTSDGETVPDWVDTLLMDILNGVAGSMRNVDDTTSAIYLMPWYPFKPPFPNVDGESTEENKLKSLDAGDYSSGVGIFMRYLNNVYGFDPAVRKALDTADSNMRQLVFDSAATVLTGNLPDWGNSLFSLFNQLGVLIMAITLSKKGDG